MIEQISSTNLITKQQYLNNNIQHNVSFVANTTPQSESDTVELSAKQKVKNKSSKLSVAQKIGIASAALLTGVVAAVVTRKMTYLSRAQKTFEDAFMKDFSKEDTINLLNKFKDISKIPDNKEYITELLNLGRKEYGLEHLDIKLKFADLKSDLGEMVGGINFLLNLYVDKNAKRKDFVNIIFHELKHAKQFEMMYSADSDRFLRGLFNRKWGVDKLKKNKGFQRLAELNGLTFEQNYEEIVNLIIDKKLMQLIFGDLPYGQTKIAPKHNGYIEKLFKANESYDDSDVIKYYFNFLEQDANKAGKRISKITKHIPNNLNCN